MNETDNLLEFDDYGGGSCPVQYECRYADHEYYIRYRYGWLTITRDLGTSNEQLLLEQQLSENEYDGYWSDEETNVYLHLISNAIKKNQWESFKIPSINDVHQHEYFKKGRYPKYIHKICYENHTHSTECERTVSAAELEKLLSPDDLKRHNEYQGKGPTKI